MKTVIVAVVLPILLVFVIAFGSIWIGTINHEASLINLFTQQQKANEASFDTMWKIIKQQTGIAEAERDSFRKTYTEIMTATQGVAGNGQLASFFTQAKIDITPDIFLKVANSIESQRESFLQSQIKLLDIKREHDNLRTTIPSRFFVSGTVLEAKIVTSSQTEQVFSRGKEDL